MVFTYLHAIFLFRISVRKNNTKGFLIAQKQFMPIFFARNQPTYRKIMIFQFHLHMKLPEEIKRLAYANMAVSNTGNDGRCQGGDACLGEINKKG